MPIELSVIIVSYNTKAILRKCLTNLINSITLSGCKDNIEVIVVDNNSRDGSKNLLAQYQGSVKSIFNRTNKGFAGANNRGIAKARGEYILLLNSDVIVYENTIKETLRLIRKGFHGVYGCLLKNPDESVQFSCGFFPTLTRVFFWMFFIDDLKFLSPILKPYHVENEAFYSKEHEADWVSGAFFLVNKDAITRSGTLDEKIFMYGEEVEWCYRIKANGFKVFYTPAVAAVHLKGASSLSGDAAGIKEELVSLLYFYRKHKSHLQEFMLKLLLKAGALLRLFLFGIISRHPKRIPIYAQILKMV